MKLLDGNRRFRARYWAPRRERLRRLRDGQQPVALFIGCADSRVVPNLILDAEPGELFVVRQIAAIVPAPERAAARPLAAALEYALNKLGVRHIIVCGHDRCGGLAALLDGRGRMTSPLTDWLDEADVDEHSRCELAALPARRAIEVFTERQLAALARYPEVTRAVNEGRATLHAWIYDLEDGKVRVRSEDGLFRAAAATRLRPRRRDLHRVAGRRGRRDVSRR